MSVKQLATKKQKKTTLTHFARKVAILL